MKKIYFTLISLILMLMLIPASASAASDISVNGIDKPVAGNSVPYTATVSGSTYTIPENGIKWYSQVEGGTNLSSFKEVTKYELRITIDRADKAKLNFDDEDAPAIIVGGVKYEVCSEADNCWVNMNSGKSYRCYYTIRFPETGVIGSNFKVFNRPGGYGPVDDYGTIEVNNEIAFDTDICEYNYIGTVSYKWYETDKDGNIVGGIKSTEKNLKIDPDKLSLGDHYYRLVAVDSLSRQATLMIKLHAIYNLYDAKCSYGDLVYNGKSGRAPAIKVTLPDGKVLTKGEDYNIRYTKSSSSRKNVGTYSFYIDGIGDYVFDVSGEEGDTDYESESLYYFKINPAGTSIKQVSRGKGYIKPIWYKKTTQTTGYQVRYSTSKSFKSYKTKTITKNTTTSSKITKVKKGKKYYVKVRTYKKVNGRMYYSGWSKIKSVTAK